LVVLVVVVILVVLVVVALVTYVGVFQPLQPIQHPQPVQLSLHYHPTKASYPDAPQTAIVRKINFYLVFYSVLNINHDNYSVNVTIFRIKLLSK
jgi:hypothetical protein